MHFSENPLGFRIEPRDAFSGYGILDVVQPVPDEPTQVEFVVDNPCTALEMAADRGVVPQLGLRTDDAFGIKLYGNRSRSHAGGKVAKNAPDYVGRCWVNLSVTPNAITALINPLDDPISVTESAAGLAALYRLRRPLCVFAARSFRNRAFIVPFRPT